MNNNQRIKSSINVSFLLLLSWSHFSKSSLNAASFNFIVIKGESRRRDGNPPISSRAKTHQEPEWGVWFWSTNVPHRWGSVLKGGNTRSSVSIQLSLWNAIKESSPTFRSVLFRKGLVRKPLLCSRSWLQAVPFCFDRGFNSRSACHCVEVFVGRTLKPKLVIHGRRQSCAAERPAVCLWGNGTVTVQHSGLGDGRREGKY